MRKPKRNRLKIIFGKPIKSDKTRCIECPRCKKFSAICHVGLIYPYLRIICFACKFDKILYETKGVKN